tara:strand:+ start:87 stop:314 length:228 start_codon:yes stop_codon:yes gene_type:complete
MQNVVLREVLEGDSPAINVWLEVGYEGGNDGIAVFTSDTDCRVVVENKEGKLMLHVWATEYDIGRDPTHSIEIER